MSFVRPIWIRTRWMTWLILGSSALLPPAWSAPLRVVDEAAASQPPATVSYYEQVRPIFQNHCQGCHQPAKAQGGYVMTEFSALLKGGDIGNAIVPGDVEASELVMRLELEEGDEALMPKGGPPLSKLEIETIKTWIAQGARDDTPESAKRTYDAEHPPIYNRPPVVAALDFSPDGRFLAVGGFHETLLMSADGSQRLARLIGVSERIESVKFSPDGKRLAVSGGLPARMGEIQVWNVETGKLLLSVPVTYDTVYGVNWSPDGTLISFGCADNTVRAIDSRTGKQVVYMGSHNDWALDTVFTKDGSRLVSVSRDMTAKLTEVATQRFIDNLTSITPGALKGGLAAVARHPERDEIVVGGSDGKPRVYRIDRLTARVIGDDSNLIRQLPGVNGRINDVAVSPDGKRIAVVGGLDGQGELVIHSYEFDTGLPEDIKAINAKVISSRTAEENAKLAAYHVKDIREVARVGLASTALYAVAFAADGQSVAVAGTDGLVRVYETETGKPVREFLAAPVGESTPTPAEALAATPNASVSNTVTTTSRAWSATGIDLPGEINPPSETLPPGRTVTTLSVAPQAIELDGPFAYAQLVVSATLDSGDVVDVTRMVRYELSAPVAAISPTGMITAENDGRAELKLTLGDRVLVVPVSVTRHDPPADPSQQFVPDFVRDVNPVLSKLGCNQGTCHGAAQGKNGFKLSLRGYDPIFDIRALTDDHAARRVNLASAEDSLMLLKPTGSVPHQGGRLMTPGSTYHTIVRDWIAAGAKLNRDTPKVVKIELFPLNPVVQTVGGRQQLRVLATYADGRVKDVTREAFIESGNTEVATADRNGLMTSLRRGEAPMLARYEGAYAATTLTVMGNRDGFQWTPPPSWGRIDDLVAAKWQRMKIQPSELTTDAEFLRRVYLDLTGLPPTPEEVSAFLADSRDTRVKRDEVIDRLIGSEAFIEHWTNKWADLLQVNSKFLGPEGAKAFRDWIRNEVAANTPYDQFARKILTASGSTRENPAASYFKILRSPDAIMENTTHLFLGVRFNCNKCHDHPFERWTQDQYYQTAAYFARVGLDTDPESKGRMIGGTAVEGGKPLYEIVSDKPEGEVIHDRTQQPTPPKFPFECHYSSPGEGASRRAELAAWITSPDNAYFAKSYVNRLWGYLLGVGIMEPIDDLRAGNPPSNPELLDYLTAEFLASGMNPRAIMAQICKSRVYQLSVKTNRWNEDDTINFSHAQPRRLPAETLYDAIHAVTGVPSTIPGVPPGTRAAAIPDSGIDLPSGFFATFGRPVRESACECERSSDLQLGPVMALVSGPTLADAIAAPNNAIAKLAETTPDDRDLIASIYLRVLNRPATPAEIEAGLEFFTRVELDHAQVVADLAAAEAEAAPRTLQRAKARLEAIDQARAALEAYQPERLAKLKEAEARRLEAIAQAEKAVEDYKATKFGEKLAAWEAEQTHRVAWSILEPTDLKGGAKDLVLTREADGSITASGPSAKTTYVVTAPAPAGIQRITALRLEAMTDPRLPANGPGRAQNGNFVVNELTLKVGPKDDPKAAQPVKIKAAHADYTQPGFDPAHLFDGQTGQPNNGWAIHPAMGVTHWVTLELDQPIEVSANTMLTVALAQNYTDGQHALGRFRLAVSGAENVGLSLAGEYDAILSTPASERTEQQTATLRNYFAALDEEFRKLVAAVDEAKKPVPPDPRQLELEAALARARAPLQPEPRLVQLRADLEMSLKQVANPRLTAAQDLTWALINSPAFLFNH